MLKVMFSAKPAAWEEYRETLMTAFDAEGLDVDLSRDHDPAEVDYIVFAPNGPVSDFRPYTKTKAVLSLWAGVETVVGNETLTQPLLRMVDHGLTAGMVEWVVGHTLRHHLGMDAHITQQDGVWRDTVYPPIAAQRTVTILGIGALGAACGQALHGLGFPVRGWSRTPKQIENIECFSGDDGLRDTLSGAEVVILLLPDTPDTRHVLNAETLGLLARGGFVINPGRGPLIDDDSLLAALDRGQVAHATLDVFDVEPLPKDHPFWSHPNVTVTPHIASTTRADTASQVIAQQIKRGERGEPFLHVVDRQAGY
ncbi:glyoxylate/hydroxypyruvate reductase A [Cognatiyoonia sediminum]|uniref:Glyoxylate/hydroxypyruvate reductase A n=1 Tax=Cognatiyoonia sediminum TaxID=1508389 RepID=A0A1M5NX68_9RHOB|nr:glyoxylate/hydroxypyruvate reductase A [Cognatiyoonia sediminum]SHG94087.1 glyoxylate/hydroxypyruvate reductase A [Cognatiyoonia sediminum]